MFHLSISFDLPSLSEEFRCIDFENPEEKLVVKKFKMQRNELERRSTSVESMFRFFVVHRETFPIGHETCPEEFVDSVDNEECSRNKPKSD